MVNIPKLKKKVHAFLIGEEGKISKESLLKAGTILGIIAISGTLNVNDTTASTHSDSLNHANGLSLSASETSTTGTHNHHANHSNHTNY